MAELGPKHTHNMSFLVDIYVAQPHLFIGARLHSTCRAARDAWRRQCGREIHAEYKFAMLRAKASIGMHLNVFQWDKVNLISVKFCDDTLITSHIYDSESADFRYTVKIYNYSSLNRVVYYLSKHDLVNDITITLDFSVNVFGVSAAELFSHIGLFYYIYTIKDQVQTSFSVVTQHDEWQSRAFISCAADGDHRS